MNIAYAETNPAINSFLTKLAVEIINPLIGLAFAVAVVVFMWGLFKLIKGGDDPEVRKTAKINILASVIGFFIMFSVYGIIHLVLNTIGVPVPSGL